MRKLWSLTWAGNLVRKVSLPTTPSSGFPVRSGRVDWAKWRYKSALQNNLTIARTVAAASPKSGGVYWSCSDCGSGGSSNPNLCSTSIHQAIRPSVRLSIHNSASYQLVSTAPLISKCTRARELLAVLVNLAMAFIMGTTDNDNLPNSRLGWSVRFG